MIRLRPYWWNTSKDWRRLVSQHNKAKTLPMEQVNGRKFTEKKEVEEFHLTNLASLGSLASKKLSLFNLSISLLEGFTAKISPLDYHTNWLFGDSSGHGQE